ncbi:MAG: glycosyltransferase family 2 protein [Propionibacteriaceae bacterium]|jgi:glycosyltransferase involved in cell wall biosynthesis|nr:glycosyltransferase family 2 protein [Propionibacteriaceae bacterium]
MPQVTVVIPVHDSETFLAATLESVRQQSLEDIEIICVDDGSTDGSAAILAEHAAADARVKVITFADNRSTLQARKAGVAAASGEFLMFLDADDYYEPDACKSAVTALRNLDADIVHFPTNLIPAPNTSKTTIEFTTRLLQPFTDSLDGFQIAEACFGERRFSWFLWNKIFDTELVRRAYTYIADDAFETISEDCHLFFIIAALARRLAGITGPPLVNYRLGFGHTAQAEITPERLRWFTGQKDVAEAIAAFAAGRDARYNLLALTVRKAFVNQTVRAWLLTLPPEQAAAGFKLLRQAWEPDELATCLYENFHFRLEKEEQLRHKAREFKRQAAELQAELDKRPSRKWGKR